MKKHKCITFDFEAQNALPKHIQDKMIEDRKKAEEKQLGIGVVSKPLNATFKIGDKVIVNNVVNGQIIFVNEHTGLIDVEVANQTIFTDCKPEWLKKGSF